MSAAIYYVPEGYTTQGPRLMGRNAAGESFLRGFFAYGKNEDMWVQVERREDAKTFLAAARSAGRSERVIAVGRENLAPLARVGTLYLPGPGLAEHAWYRSALGQRHWSLCGLTHTTSSARAMDALTDIITAPVQPWDALICTSNAVRDNVRSVWQAQYELLQERLGCTRCVLPQTPVIPLGVHAEDFVYTETQRRQARESIGAGSQTIVVLFVGRLSFHAKAHPLAMYQALQKASQKLQKGQDIVLVECGWHANDAIAQAYAEAARLACPNVRVVTLDGRTAAARQTAWAGADVFCSLSDNIQETFGITPIEAMAAGLPVVVSDWDGYKDTVREGVDGFRIPTTMPAAGMGRDLATRHALGVDSYDMYCGHTCSLVAMDIEAAAQAFSQLFSSPQLRTQMGQAGRRRVSEVYDWKVVFAQYEALWAQLTELRVAASSTQPIARWPARLDPFEAFAAYPTSQLYPSTQVRLIDERAQVAQAKFDQYCELAMVKFAESIMATHQECHALLQKLEQGACAIEYLVQEMPEQRRGVAARSVAWLMKLGLIAKHA